MANSVNLRELFSTRIFRIPDYQRGYAWEEKQLIDLWDDLEDILEDNGVYKKHYTGTIYLEECKPLENEQWLSGVTFFYVVDGQQRLATISIFLFELLKLAPNGHSGECKEDLVKTYLCKANSSENTRVFKFSYDHTDTNHDFLLKTIYEDQSVILQDNSLNVYRKNLIKAKAFFATKLSALTAPEREILFKKLTTALQFDVRTIEQDLDVQEVFETMNNRGKPLSTLEKLKNRLIYLTVKLSDKPEDKRNLKKKINGAWGKIYSALAQNPDSILDEDVFLSAHLSLYRKPTEAVFSEKAAEEKVFQMFCNRSAKFDKDDSGIKELNVSYAKIEDYVIKLSEAAPVWYQIHNSASLILKKILRISGGKELKVFLLALLMKCKKENLEPVFINVEQILFRNLTLRFFDERIAATWGGDIYRDEVNLENLKQKLKQLMQVPISTPALIHSMSNLFTYVYGKKGFHRWGALKYFLFDYEEHLKHRFKETTDKVSIDNFDATTIEHIIPQEWTEHWSEVVNDFGLLVSEEKRGFAVKVLINTLGNLTILKYDKNPSLGKLGWAEKRIRYSTGSYNEIHISKNAAWTKREIAERGIDMLSFLEGRIQGLKMSDDEKKKMLFYEDDILRSS